MKIIKQAKKSNGRLPLRAYLAYLLVCTLLLTGITFSKYVTFSDATDSARVAKGIVTVWPTDPTAIEMREKDAGEWRIGYSTFDFYVSNENSEVAITYDIVVTLDGPLQSGVTMIWKGLPAEESATVTDSGKKYTFSNVGTFEAGGQQPHKHTLGFIVYFDNIAGVGQYDYDIDISVESHQID